MKSSRKLGILFLAAAVVASVAAGMNFPVKAGSFDVPDPRVTLRTGASAPSGVDVGGVFDLDLTFTHTFDKEISDDTASSNGRNNRDDMYNKIFQSFPVSISDPTTIYAVIGVSCGNGSVSIAKSKYTVKATCELAKDNTGDIIITYDLYIPQRDLRRVGSNAGVLAFAVTYYSDAAATNRLKNFADSSFVVPTFYAVYQAFPRIAGASSSGSESESRLSVASYRLDRTPVKEGEKFSLTLSVKNSGNAPCGNVTSVLVLADGSGLSLDGVTDTKMIPQLAAGASAELTYPMTCMAKMSTGNYAVGITLSGDGCAAATSKIYVPVTGTKDAASSAAGDSKPQIIIESYDYGGKAVTGGQEFNLAMNLRNTGSIAIENCKMTVGSTEDNTASASAGSVFTPAKSSNTFFISRLAPGTAVRKEIALLPKADAAPNSYGIIVAFKYDAVVDGKRQSLDASETITVPLTQPDRFEVGEPELDEQMFAGQPGQLNIGYVNKGKSGVYNLAVKLEGNFQTKDGSTNIGNLESGASDTYQASVTPNAEGDLKGTATFSYEDSTGKAKTVVKSFSCQVSTEANEPAMRVKGELANRERQAHKGGTPWWVWLVAACGAVAAIIVARVLVKKHKAKKLRLLEESDDEEELPGGNGQ